MIRNVDVQAWSSNMTLMPLEWLITTHRAALRWRGPVWTPHAKQGKGGVLRFGCCRVNTCVAILPKTLHCWHTVWVPTITTASFPSPPLFPDSRAFGARHQNVRLNKESPPSKWRFFSTSFLRREGEHFLPVYPLCCAGFTQRGSAAVDIGSLSDELFVNTHTPNSLIQMATSAALGRQCRFLAASWGRGGVRRSIMVFKVRSLLLRADKQRWSIKRAKALKRVYRLHVCLNFLSCLVRHRSLGSLGGGRAVLRGG